MQTPQRQFEDKPAVRESVPLLVGLFGPSGGGKTFSALRLATGIQQVTGGEIYYIDTESRRALHYAFDPATGKGFKFRHIAFGAPFGPLDYLAAIEHCVAKGAQVVVVDSMSHEHEGPGGVLEMHETEMERIGKGDKGNFLAWQKPKQERRRLLNTILQMPANFIFCFRAKEKLKMEQGKQPVPLGFMPIAGEEFVFEMTANCLLAPNAGGVPCWISEYAGEKMMMKLPQQFRELLSTGRPMDEAMGHTLAEWARGGVAPATTAPAGEVGDLQTLVDLGDGKASGTKEALKLWWDSLNPAQRVALKDKLPAWKEKAQ
jgi:energy-coupling factor transporter ATP-binding protein EcfA2